MPRILPINKIPTSMWNNQNSILYLAPLIVDSWKTLLYKYGLEEMALIEPTEGFVGGMSEEETKKHLAWRYTGSCARIMLAMLDPHDELTDISDVFMQVFSGNKVFLADLPIGSGASSITILSVLYELRKQSVIPRIPLEVIIVGGEISEFARNYAQENFKSLVHELKTQAITLQFKVVNWDACNNISNIDLINELIAKGRDCDSKFLILANFSAFLQKDGKWMEAKDQFDKLFLHSRDEKSVALWIEPGMNIVKNNFMPRIIEWFKKLFSPIFGFDALIEKTYAESKADVRHPLKDEKFRNNIIVVQFDLPKKSLL